MASKSGLCLALLLIATASSVANALLIQGINKQVSGLNIVGQLAHPDLPIDCVGGVVVSLVDTVTKTVLCTTVTDSLGKFVLSPNLVGIVSFLPSQYVVSVVTPITGFVSPGVLQAPLGDCNLISGLISGLLNLLANITCGGFSFIPI